MRLISYDDFCKEVDKHDLLVGSNASFAKEIARRTPYIESKPVRHGQWEIVGSSPKSYIRRCTACRKKAYYCGIGCSYRLCPHCGAEMEILGK